MQVEKSSNKQKRLPKAKASIKVEQRRGYRKNDTLLIDAYNKYIFRRNPNDIKDHYYLSDSMLYSPS